MIKLFLGIFTRLKKIFRNIFNMCFCPRTVADRPGRPTAPKAGRPLRSTDVHRLVHVWQTQGRSAGRPTETESLLSVSGRSAVRSIGCPNGHISDRWRSAGPADRRPVRLTDQPNG